MMTYFDLFCFGLAWEWFFWEKAHSLVLDNMMMKGPVTNQVAAILNQILWHDASTINYYIYPEK